MKWLSRLRRRFWRTSSEKGADAFWTTHPDGDDHYGERQVTRE